MFYSRSSTTNNQAHWFSKLDLHTCFSIIYLFIFTVFAPTLIYKTFWPSILPVHTSFMVPLLHTNFMSPPPHPYTKHFQLLKTGVDSGTCPGAWVLVHANNQGVNSIGRQLHLPKRMWFLFGMVNWNLQLLNNGATFTTVLFTLRSKFSKVYNSFWTFFHIIGKLGSQPINIYMNYLYNLTKNNINKYLYSINYKTTFVRYVIHLMKIKQDIISIVCLDKSI